MEEEQDNLEQAIAQSLLSLSSSTQTNPLDTFQPGEDEGIDKEETRFFIQKFMQQGQWCVIYLDEAWQLAKRSFFQVADLPILK